MKHIRIGEDESRIILADDCFNAINEKIDKNKQDIEIINKDLNTQSQLIATNTKNLDNTNKDLKTNYLTAQQTDDKNNVTQNDMKEWTTTHFTAAPQVNQIVEDYLRKIPDILEVTFAPNCTNHTVYLATITQGNHNPLVMGSNYKIIDTAHPFFIVISQQNSDNNLPHGVSVSIDNLENPQNKLVITRQGGVRENWSGSNLFPEEIPAGKFVFMNRGLVLNTEQLGSSDGLLKVTAGHADSNHPYGYVEIDCMS